MNQTPEQRLAVSSTRLPAPLKTNNLPFAPFAAPALAAQARIRA